MDFKLTNFCEIDKFAIESYCRIHDTNPSLNLGDISFVNTDDIEDFDLLVGGSPCQDFSSAGKKAGSVWTCKDCGYKYNPLEAHHSQRDKCPHCGSKNLEKTRSSLIVEYLRFLKEKQPKFAIYENVKNIIGKEFRNVFNMFLNELDDIVYKVYWEVMNAKYYGIPQNRERVNCVIIRKDIDKGFSFPQKIDIMYTIRDIVQDKIPKHYYISEDKSDPLVKELIDRGKLSENYKYFNNRIIELGLLNMKGSEQIRRVYAKNGLSPTLTTCQGGHQEIKILEDQVHQLFNINPSGHGINGSVYYSLGLSPTLTTNKGEGSKVLFPLVGEYRTDSHLQLRKHNVCGTLRTIDSCGDKRIIEPLDLPLCVACRGRYELNPNLRIAGLPTKQRLEPNENGTI